MMMPSAPLSGLIVRYSGFTFAILKGAFHPEPLPLHLGQLTCFAGELWLVPAVESDKSGNNIIKNLEGGYATVLRERPYSPSLGAWCQFGP